MYLRACWPWQLDYTTALLKRNRHERVTDNWRHVPLTTFYLRDSKIAYKLWNPFVKFHFTVMLLIRRCLYSLLNVNLQLARLRLCLRWMSLKLRTMRKPTERLVSTSHRMNKKLIIEKLKGLCHGCLSSLFG